MKDSQVKAAIIGACATIMAAIIGLVAVYISQDRAKEDGRAFGIKTDPTPTPSSTPLPTATPALPPMPSPSSSPLPLPSPSPSPSSAKPLPQIDWTDLGRYLIITKTGYDEQNNLTYIFEPKTTVFAYQPVQIIFYDNDRVQIHRSISLLTPPIVTDWYPGVRRRLTLYLPDQSILQKVSSIQVSMTVVPRKD